MRDSQIGQSVILNNTQQKTIAQSRTNQELREKSLPLSRTLLGLVDVRKTSSKVSFQYMYLYVYPFYTEIKH